MEADGRAVADELLRGDSAAPVTPAYDSPRPPEVQAEDKEIARFPVPLVASGVRVVPVSEMFK